MSNEKVITKETISKISDLLESGLKKLEQLPRNVIDPVKWMEVHKPELLKDPDITACLVIVNIEKIRKKYLRKQTSVSYKIPIEDRHEFQKFREMLQDAIVDYDYNTFYINMAKGLIKEYQYYIAPTQMYIKSREMSMVLKAFANQLEIITDEEWYSDEDRIVFLRFLKSFLEKKIIKHTSTCIPSINDNGTPGELKFEKKEEEITFIELIKDKTLTSVVR